MRCSVNEHKFNCQDLKGTPLLSEQKLIYRKMHHLLCLKRAVKATSYSTT